MKEFITGSLWKMTCFALREIRPDDIKVVNDGDKWIGSAVYNDGDSLPDISNFVVLDKETGEEYPLFPDPFSKGLFFIPLMNTIKHNVIFKKVDEVKNGKE